MSKKAGQERRERLYSLLLKENGWVEQECVAALMFPYYSDYDEGHFHESASRYLMTTDIQSINNDPNFEKIIICTNEGIKIAEEAEIEGYLKSQYSALFRKLKRIRNIQRKASLDGQTKININGNEKQFVEAFKEAVL